MKHLASLLLATIMTTVCAFAQTSTEWKTHSVTSYSTQYPSDWELNLSGQMSTSFIILSKQATDKDLFRENVNLQIQDLSGNNMDLDGYVKLSENQVKTLITNGNILESQRIKANGTEYHRIVFTGDQGIYKLKFEQYYWVKNDKAYALTLTCEGTEFENYKTVGEKILNSFQLK